jgi:hypothetical protein
VHHTSTRDRGFSSTTTGCTSSTGLRRTGQNPFRNRRRTGLFCPVSIPENRDHNPHKIGAADRLLRPFVAVNGVPLHRVDKFLQSVPAKLMVTIDVEIFAVD